ncbi:LOB domain-containing protein CRL1-like [Typha angustifolia]|uniref:LOB domain-containing protein CRL1-like n=1 Tax=Typha angustifolia TaxID=59011 RepID=UPI003C2C043C
MTGFGSPCGACKFLRRKCVRGCVFAPYFCHEQGAAHFAAIHKVFGASNASKLLMHLPVADRYEAAITISYEAQARLQDPIYGCVAHIFALQQQVVNLQAQLASLKGQAAQGYANGSTSTSSPQEEESFINKHFESRDAMMPQQPSASSSPVNSDSMLFYENLLLNSTSFQSSQGYDPHSYISDDQLSFDVDGNTSCAMATLGIQESDRRSAYHDMEDLQSVAFAYLNRA